MFPQIKSLDQRLYAPQSKEGVGDRETAPAHETRAGEIAEAIEKFNDDNPGVRLNAGSEHRDLGDQIWGWESNPGVRANAPEHLAEARAEIGRKAKDGTPRAPDLGDALDPATGQHVFQIGHGGPDLVALSAALLPAMIGLIGSEGFRAVARFVEFLKKPSRVPSRSSRVAAPTPPDEP